jgi:hypothetical protein
LHQCRTVCRRAERDILRLSRSEEVNPTLLKYVNGLSDLFFVLARWISKQMGEQEYLWQRGLKNQVRSEKVKSKSQGLSGCLSRTLISDIRSRGGLLMGLIGRQESGDLWRGQ